MEIIANSNVNSSESISEENVINEQSTDMKLKGLCQLESMRSEVMQITFNCQNSIVFNA